MEISEHHRRYWHYQYDVAARYMVPLLRSWGVDVRGASVLDVGCGEGGGLCAMHDAGAECRGFDVDGGRIELAAAMRGARNIPVVVGDMYASERPFAGMRFDLVMLHDVFEHLEQKDATLQKLREFLSPRGTMLITFPPYYSAFGAHQQHLRARFARLPFFHLLPFAMSRLLPRLSNEPPEAVRESMKLARLRMGMRSFEEVSRRNGLEILFKRAWLIGPNHIRYGLRPLSAGWLSRVPLLGELLCAGVAYLLAPRRT